MENRASNNADITGDTAVAIPQEAVSLGLTSEVEVGGVRAQASAVVPLGDQLQFLYSEYFKGIFFVLASALFILALPTLITKRDELRAVAGRIAKRSVDIVGALVGMILTLPVWLILPILIKLDSPGPVFYSQTRVGLDRRRNSRRYCQRTDSEERRRRERRQEDYQGSVFRMFKFRTMVDNAEGSSGPVWATTNDPRITRLGAFMRKSRLDEIPQFLNVLSGEMSLVGPRPERPKFVADLAEEVEDYTRRLEAKPGVTGLAQVESGYDSSLSTVTEKVKYDLEYIDNWSLWLDIKILLRTVVVVLTGRGAQ
jgi:lipopolysaccharide/colanic/teichoic acid biosynthesis glycosyltransferase